MQNDQHNTSSSPVTWYRIPDGTKVKLRGEEREGVIDGVTEIVNGQQLNGDLRTQYRIRMMDTHEVKLAGDRDLLFLVDHDDLVIIAKQAVSYRSYVTTRLRSAFAPTQFVA